MPPILKRSRSSLLEMRGSFVSRSLEIFGNLYKKKEEKKDQPYEYENRQVPTESEEDVVSFLSLERRAIKLK